MSEGRLLPSVPQYDGPDVLPVSEGIFPGGRLENLPRYDRILGASPVFAKLNLAFFYCRRRPTALSITLSRSKLILDDEYSAFRALQVSLKQRNERLLTCLPEHRHRPIARRAPCGKSASKLHFKVINYSSSNILPPLMLLLCKHISLDGWLAAWLPSLDASLLLYLVIYLHLVCA